MRGLLLLAPLLLASYELNDSYPFSRVREAGDARQRGREVGPGLAFFEAFPASGQGTADVLARPMPNWAVQSEGFDTGSWIGSAVVAAAPTVTANQATAPDGTVTADRVQFPATAFGQESVLYQSGTVPFTNPVVASVWVKGVADAGVIATIVNKGGGNYACQKCNYTNTAWTQCTVAADVSSTGNFVLGNESSICGNETYSANDVYLWGAQINVGTPLASGIVGAWSLNGNVRDGFGTRNGTASNITYDGGVMNDAAIFNGSSSQVTGLATSVTGYVFSYSFWVKPHSYAAYHTVSASNGTGNAIKIFISVAGKIAWDAGGGEFSTALPLNQWSHVLIYSDGTNVNAQINGVTDPTTLLVSSVSGLNANFGVSTFGNDGFGGWLNGMLDEVVLWKRVLTSTERAAVYATGRGYAFPFGSVAPYVATTSAAKGYAVTGAKGETLTFTRGSTAYATNGSGGGLRTTNINNGDMVLMPANQPRVEYDSAGTLGLRVESSRTNSLVRSQEFENAAWTAGAARGTITANYATAPDGTLTADRYQYSNTNNDYNLQTFSVGGLAASTSVYLKGTSGSGTIYMCRGGAGSQCVTCSYVSTSWSRCRYEGTLATSSNVFLGCETATLGSACAQTGFDVLVWGFQGELGAYATSYIPTTSAAVTRSAESGAAVTLSSAVGPSGCIAASVTWPSSSVGAVNVASLGVAGAGGNMTLYRTSNTAAGYQIGITTSAPAVSAIGTTTHRSVLADNAGSRLAWWDGASVTAPAASMSGGQTAFQIGAVNGGGTPADGIVSRVQVDPSFARCSLQ